MKCEAHPSEDAVGICKSCGRGACAVCTVVFDGFIHCKACVEAGRTHASKTPPVVFLAPPPWVRPRYPPPWYTKGGTRVALYAVSLLPAVGIVIGLVLIANRRRPAVLMGRRCLALGVLGAVLSCPIAAIGFYFLSVL